MTEETIEKLIEEQKEREKYTHSLELKIQKQQEEIEKLRNNNKDLLRRSSLWN